MRAHSVHRTRVKEFNLKSKEDYIWLHAQKTGITGTFGSQ